MCFSGVFPEPSPHFPSISTFSFHPLPLALPPPVRRGPSSSVHSSSVSLRAPFFLLLVVVSVVVSVLPLPLNVSLSPHCLPIAGFFQIPPPPHTLFSASLYFFLFFSWGFIGSHSSLFWASWPPLSFSNPDLFPFCFSVFVDKSGLLRDPFKVPLPLLPLLSQPPYVMAFPRSFEWSFTCSIRSPFVLFLYLFFFLLSSLKLFFLECFFFFHKKRLWPL